MKDDWFNSLYLLNDKLNYLIARWIDNNVVTMVSTVHTGGVAKGKASDPQVCCLQLHMCRKHFDTYHGWVAS